MTVCIKKYDEMFDHTLGYCIMTDRINRDDNKHYNDKQVYKSMRVLCFQSNIRRKTNGCIVRKKNITANSIHKRDFNASKTNEKWIDYVTEFKYGKHNEKKLYLSVFLDLYDRTIVGYEIGYLNDNSLVFKTFDNSIVDNINFHFLLHNEDGYHKQVLHLQIHLNNII